MLDFAINDGSTAIPGVIMLLSPNCSISANAEYGVQAIRNAKIIISTIHVTLPSARFTRPSRLEFCKESTITRLMKVFSHQKFLKETHPSHSYYYVDIAVCNHDDGQ